MGLQEFLLHKFRSWQPAAPLVLARRTGDITLTWRQDLFPFLRGDLLYRLEKNSRLPKWIVVYRGAKTSKRIDDLAPSYPHKFRLKVILRAPAVDYIVEKALQHYGDEETVRDNLRGVGDSDEEHQGGLGETHSGHVVNIIQINVVDHELEEDKEKNIEKFEKQNGTPAFYCKSKCGGGEPGGWVESAYSAETWASTHSEGSSAVCFSMAVKFGNIKQVQLMVEERPALVGLVNVSSGFTPLATAVRAGDATMVEYLVTAGADLDQSWTGGQTPLHLAVLQADLNLIKLLLHLGASITARDWNGMRVEHYAVDSGSPAALCLVLDRGGDVHARDNTGWTPLFRAVCQGAKTEMIVELVKRGSDVDVVDHAGLPLSSAAKLLKNRLGRVRGSVLRLVVPAYPHDQGLANFTRLTKKIYYVHKLLKLT